MADMNREFALSEAAKHTDDSPEKVIERATSYYAFLIGSKVLNIPKGQVLALVDAQTGKVKKFPSVDVVGNGSHASIAEVRIMFDGPSHG